MSAEQQQFGSFDPADHSQGGYLDGATVTIMAAEVCTYDFNQKTAPTTCLALTYRPEDGEADGSDDRTEYYRMGDPSKIAPSADKVHFVGGPMNRGCNASLLLASLKNAGFNMADLNGAKGVGALVGQRAVLVVSPLPSFTDKEGKTVEGRKITAIKQILEPNATVAAGGGANKPAAVKGPKKAGAAKAAAAKPAPAPAEEAGDESGEAEANPAEDATVAAILEKLSETGTLAKTGVASLLFGAIKDPETRKAAVKLGTSEAWLADDARPWNYADGELTLG